MNTIGVSAKKYPLEIVSLGEDIFLNRFSNHVKFEGSSTGNILKPVVRALQSINYNNWIGKFIALLNEYFPLYVTVIKSYLHGPSSFLRVFPSP